MERIKIKKIIFACLVCLLLGKLGEMAGILLYLLLFWLLIKSLREGGVKANL